MSDIKRGLRRPAPPIFADEIGIEIGIVGRYRVKTSYQVIYRRGEQDLFPCMLRARGELHLDGRRVSQAALPKRGLARDSISMLSAILALRNYRNADGDGLDLYLEGAAELRGGTDWIMADVSRLARAAEDLDIMPPRLICELDASSENLLALRAQSNVLRRQGARVALAQLCDTSPLTSWIDDLRPDTIRIDATWFNRICRHPASRKLLGALVRAVHERGASVLIEGLDTASALQAAISVGADFFEGDALQPSGLVGVVIDTSSVRIASLQQPSNVIPLQRLGRVRPPG